MQFAEGYNAEDQGINIDRAFIVIEGHMDEDGDVVIEGDRVRIKDEDEDSRYSINPLFTRLDEDCEEGYIVRIPWHKLKYADEDKEEPENLLNRLIKNKHYARR